MLAFVSKGSLKWPSMTVLASLWCFLSWWSARGSHLMLFMRSNLLRLKLWEVKPPHCCLQMLSVSCRRSHVNEGSGCVVFFNMLDFVLLNCCHYWHILIAFCVKIPSVLTVAELHSLRKQSYLVFPSKMGGYCEQKVEGMESVSWFDSTLTSLLIIIIII